MIAYVYLFYCVMPTAAGTLAAFFIVITRESGVVFEGSKLMYLATTSMTITEINLCNYDRLVSITKIIGIIH